MSKASSFVSWRESRPDLWAKRHSKKSNSRLTLLTVSNITVQANNVVQCSQASVSWTGAVDPVTLYIAIGGFYIGDRPIETRSDVYGGSADWLVNVKAGESLHFRVTDANNQVAYVQGIQVQQGDSWCLDAGSSSSASPAGTSGSPSPSPSPAPSADGGSGGTESQGSPATTSSRSTGSRLSRSSSSAQATQAAGEQASSADESSGMSSCDPTSAYHQH